MPMNTPQAKKPVVTCCSHSHGAPISRVTTSRNTEPVKPMINAPHSTIRPASSGSSAFHLRWRWRWRTRLRSLTTRIRGTRGAGRLLHVAHELEDGHGVGSQFLGELVLDRLRGLGEARLVDT